MNIRRRNGCIAIVGFLILLQGVSPSYAIRMRISAREATTRARNVASAIQEAEREIADDTNDVENKEAGSEDARERKRRQRNAIAKSSQDNTFSNGQHNLLEVGGGTRAFADYYFGTKGSAKIVGSNILPNGLLVELTDTSRLTFDSDAAAEFNVRAAFSGVTFQAPPFFLQLEEIVGDGFASVSEIAVMPIDGESTHVVSIPHAGSYRFTVQWIVPEFALPPGDSNFGIEAYSFRAFVPEPTSALMVGCCAMLLMGCCGRLRRA